jgi:hypothetical protein
MMPATTKSTVLAAVIARVRARIAAERSNPDGVRATHSASIPEQP